jgi:hypothetical protein
MIIDARRRAADKGAKARHHTLFVGIHDIDARGEPYGHDDQPDDKRAATAEAFGKHLPELFLATP